MKLNDNSKEFWGKLIYATRTTPHNIKTKITSYMFENSISEIDMIDEFILHSCFFILNNQKKRILAQAVPSKQSDPNSYEVFRFLNIIKFLFPCYEDSTNYQNFKSITETGNAIEDLPFPINIVGYTIYASTIDSDVSKVDVLNIFTPKLAQVFEMSSYEDDTVSRLAFHVLETIYIGVDELHRSVDDIVNNQRHGGHLESISTAIVNMSGSPQEMLSTAVDDYNHSFYAFIERIKREKNKSVLKEMKDDILSESFTVINEDIKPEVINYFKLI